MKKIYLLFLAILLSVNVFGQITSYTFSHQIGTFTPNATSATGVSAVEADSGISSALPIGFTFNYGSGGVYTQFFMSSNGFISLGATGSTLTTNDLSSANASNRPIIAPLWDDLDGNATVSSTKVSKASYLVTGSAPNRVLTVEWLNWEWNWNSSSPVMSFQVKLYETTNKIEFVYRQETGAINGTGSASIGINDTSGAGTYLNLNTTLTTPTVTSTTSVTTISTKPANNQVFVFTPPPICTGAPVGGTVSPVNQMVCGGSTPAAISVPFSNPGFSGYIYQWEESDDNGVTDAWADAVGGTGATTLTYTPPSFAGTTNKYYRLKTTCTASAQSAYSTVHTVLIAASPNATTALTFTNIGSTSMTIGWTNANGNRRLVVISPVNTFVARTNGTGPAHTATAAFTGTGEQIVYDGTGSSVAVTGLACNTMYYVRVYEYVRCGSATPYGYWYGTALQGSQVTGQFFTTAVGLPASTNFAGYSGSNLTTVFPGWIEAKGNGPLTVVDGAWTSNSNLGVTAKINLYTTGKNDWIVSPTVTVNAFSRVKFKAAITDYNTASAHSAGMQGTDDSVTVMISTDVCGATWVPLYTFNASNTTTLTNVLTDYILTIPSSYVGQNIRIGFKGSEGTVDDTPDYDFHIGNVVIQNTPPPSVTTTKTNNVCFGGSTGTASAIPLDGTPPYSYSWSPSGGTGAIATGLAAGTYTVTITDTNNLTATATTTVGQPDILAGNPTITQVTCNGANNGSITIAPTGGTLPYSYLWSTGATSGTSLSNLTPGTYSVTITDVNACTTTENFTITEPSVLTATKSAQTDVTMYGGNDGSATVAVSGGTAPYSYLWSNGATTATASNLIAGTYTVKVTDANGCTATQSFTIIQPIPLMVQSVSQTNVSCNAGTNGTATIVAMGGNAPYTYLWNNGVTTATASNLTAGTYTVTVTDSTGNIITESFTITEPAALAATIVKTDITCNFASNGTATVSVTGGTTPYTYFWSNGMTSATANNLNVGNYTVTITDANNCKTTATVSITQPTALVVTQSSTNITCYGLNDGTATVSVTGGTAPYVYSWSNGQTGNSLSSLGKGTYMVTITDANNCTTTQSFTITEPAFVHPPVAVNQSFCVGQNATLANMVISGSNIKWYSAANGGTLLPATTVLTNGTTYYASQTVGTCESATRTAVQVTLNQGIPLTTTQVSVCSNTRVQNMTIDGFNYTQLKWYSSATSTVVLPASQLLASTTYYVSSVIGTCESPRQAIQVTVATLVPAPTASAQTACGNTTLNDLTVVKDPSATLRWYTSLQSMIPLAGTTQVSTGTYYVQQVIGACESVRVAVPVQVVTATVPTMTTIATCDGNTIADLHPSTGTYVWYVNNTTTTALPDSFIITSGNYYIAYEIQGCISSRVNVAVNVNARPASPTGQSNQLFGFAARVSDLKMNQPNVSWFASFNDAVKQVNQLSANHVLQDATTYYGILTGANNCGSLVPTAVTVTINLSNAELDLTQLKYYPNPVDSELNISYIEEIKKVEVFTITGQRVFGKDYQVNEVKVDLSSLSSGTYMVKIETAKASQFVKIVKR